MPRQIGRARMITLAILSMAVLSITLVVLAQTQTQPKPFMTITGEASRIDYYNVSNAASPTLVIRAYLNNTPVPVTVSLFAFTTTKIYTVGYYYGEGTISINLTSPLIREVAGEWQVTELWPSLLAFVTYVSNETRTIRFIILAIPYDPRWIISNEHVTIMATINLTMTKPLPIPRNLTKSTTMQMTNAKINITDPYGYTYVGSCMGNSVPLSPSSLPYVPGLSSTGWQLESCYEFNGPIPLFFVSWGSGIWSNGITNINIALHNGEAQAGSGFYASYAIYNTTGYYILSTTSNGPTITFSQSVNMYLYEPVCNAYEQQLAITHGSSLSSACMYGQQVYYVPGSGTMFVGPIGYVAAVTYYYCLFQGGSCTPTYIANGTMVLGLSSLSSGILTIYPYLDIGNGSVTNTLAVLINQGLAGKAFSVLDGQYISYNPSTESSPTYVQACNNAPNPSSLSNSVVEYGLQKVLVTYNPGIPAWGADVGGVIAEIIAEVVLGEVPPIIGPLIGFAVSYILNYFTSSEATIYQNYLVNIYTNPNMSWQFYTTFVGSPAITVSSGNEYYWPAGIVINGSGYYLDYLPYLYPWPGSTVCQG
ncbi:hypothetical protein JCM16161A_12950 [Vulcanisaeta sp. JCM 16161]